MRVLMTALTHAIVKRRRYNARAEQPRARVDQIYEYARTELIKTAGWTRRAAVEQENHRCILNPGWKPKEGEGPVAKWTKEWIASNFFTMTPRGLQCQLPESVGEVQGAAVNRGVEQCIAVDPVQYLWSYKRFRAQPEGQPPFYSQGDAEKS